MADRPENLITEFVLYFLMFLNFKSLIKRLAQFLIHQLASVDGVRRECK